MHVQFGGQPAEETSRTDRVAAGPRRDGELAGRLAEPELADLLVGPRSRAAVRFRLVMRLPKGWGTMSGSA